jgi:hypothetical protein
VKNNAKINKDFSIAELKLQIEKLENEITKYRSRMNILENIMEDNGLLIPSINESFCLDGLKNLLAQKTKEFKEFAIESNNTLKNASESNNTLSHKNKYIQEFLIENKNEDLEENKNNKEFYASEQEENNLKNSYLKISEGEEEMENNNESSEESKTNNSNYSLEEDNKERINRISEDDSENNSDSDPKISFENKKKLSDLETDFNKHNKNEKLDRTENNPNNITTGNAKYLELIEMFTKLDKKKSHIEEDLNYAVERIREFKIDETRKNNLINDILRMKEKSTQKIDNLGGEINDVINKTIIQCNNNNESCFLNLINSNNHINKENKENNNNEEILAELKNEFEAKKSYFLIESNKKEIDKNNLVENELNIEFTSTYNKKENKKITVCQENIINLNFVKEEKHFQTDNEKIKITNDKSEEVINTSKNSRKSFEKSKEISFEINNSSSINNLNHNNPNNNSKNMFSSKIINNNDKLIETGIRINFNCDRSSYKILSNNDDNMRRISITNNNLNLNKYRNSDTGTKKQNFSEINNENINLQFLKTTNFAAGESVNLRNLINEDYFSNQVNDFKINSNKNTNINHNENFSLEINTNNSKDRMTQINDLNINTNFNNIIDLKIEGKSLNNILSDVAKNEQATPKIKTNFFKKYSNISNNSNNFILNGINTKNINSDNNSLNSSNLNMKIPNNNNNNNDLSEKDKKIIKNPSTNNTNEKEFSLSKLKLSTPLNHEDEFITSTNPQTNNLLVNEFASSIDDDKNKVIEDLFFKLKEYSNKIPELNNLIETYKDKLNVKNPDQNFNLANILQNHFTDNYDFNLNNNNKHKEINIKNSESEAKNNSIEQKLKLININNLDNNCKNLNNINNKSLLSEKESNKQANGNSYSEKNVNVSRDSKKTEEIISHLELKAEKVLIFFFNDLFLFNSLLQFLVV